MSSAPAPYDLGSGAQRLAGREAARLHEAHPAMPRTAAHSW
ncbi:hypothetical protein [Archangium lipolyticum]|nr:hypothetical protein [Archangium lipolyticum]